MTCMMYGSALLKLSAVDTEVPHRMLVNIPSLRRVTVLVLAGL